MSVKADVLTHLFSSLLNEVRAKSIFSTLGCAVQAWKCAPSLYCSRHRGTEHPGWRKGSWCWHTFGDTDTQKKTQTYHSSHKCLQLSFSPSVWSKYLHGSLWALNHHHLTFSSRAGTQTSAVLLEWRRLESLCPKKQKKMWTDQKHICVAFCPKNLKNTEAKFRNIKNAISCILALFNVTCSWPVWWGSLGCVPI